MVRGPKGEPTVGVPKTTGARSQPCAIKHATQARQEAIASALDELLAPEPDATVAPLRKVR
jgi:hypothetical protein